jgi:hypothetical protein
MAVTSISGLPAFAFLAILSFSPFGGCNDHSATAPVPGPTDNKGPIDPGPSVGNPTPPPPPPTSDQLGGGSGNHNPPPPPPPPGNGPGGDFDGGHNGGHNGGHGDGHGGHNDGHDGKHGGDGWDEGGGPHGGTPEPGTLLLVTGSAAGYAALRRRRKGAAQVESDA